VDVGDVEPSTDDERRRHAEARERQARRKGDA
jgi:hypothetical protein